MDPFLQPPEISVISKRNDSFGRHGRRWLFLSLCLVSFGLAAGFAAIGAWFVLPYSVLEMVVLYGALRYFERHAGDWEKLELRGDRLIVEVERGGVRRREEFNRFWARVEQSTAPHRRGLAIVYAGRRVPFGHTMASSELAEVARDLQRALARQ
jgi:uncharacterized membrane protein